MNRPTTAAHPEALHTAAGRYALSIRILHWLMAIGFLFMWGCGYSMTTLVAEDSRLEELLFGLHISIGVSLLVLLLIRVGMRLATTARPLPDGLRRLERTGARLGHFGLYLLPVLIIVMGWAETDFGGHGVKWFGVAMPKIFPTMETLAGINLETLTATLHKWSAYSMLGLAVVHVAAAAKHQLIDGHDILHRMTLGTGRAASETKNQGTDSVRSDGTR